MTPLCLHLPHDSDEIPPTALPDFLVPAEVLRRECLRLTDRHTAALFAAGADPEDVVRAEVSRLVVDVERFPDDADEPCAAFGMGATYLRTTEGLPLRALTPARRAELLALHYWPHHRRLEAAVTARLARFEGCVILDAHSYPTRPLPTQPAFAAMPEIGLGTEGAHTPPALRGFAEAFFRDRGFEVRVDVPFRGSIVPIRYLAAEFRVRSLMVEVRRDLYMDEATGAPHAGFDRMRAVLTAFRDALAAFAAT